ncbi:unnamed protein product [Arctia plantaginis]|uniref:Blastoderm-specific protein 25D n=1 Tax=Arctia plantaginis TaxID=874455 RepID=A0A8S1AZV2_ARCPL|nr:unnamed protein product [Arctia plantaginis]
MDDESMNRYEKQLYTVFKTFDVDNEEALDRSAVHELCDALQLEDRGAALVHTLFERRSDRVTFTQFRNGLLAVLGGAGGESVPANVAPPSASPQRDPGPQQSDDDSSGREVAPKFVFGSKKYGRRSRPPRVATNSDEPANARSSSASRIDTEDKRSRQRMKCRRSTSAMESRNDSSGIDVGMEAGTPTETFEHDRRIDRDEALALCRGLHMDSIDRHLVDRIFEDTGTTDTTVGEFFDRLNSSLTTTIEETTRESRAPAAGGDAAIECGDDETGAGVPSDLVLEAFERAGVQQPRRLLVELGFAASALRPPELERALDNELRALPEAPPERREARALLLTAALALSRLRHELARRRVEITTAERDKLRGDVIEANKRAGILAQEVDESQARIESELKASMRRAEVRQAEASRQAAAEIASERERAAAIRNRLEAEITRRSEAELRARNEAEASRENAEELEMRLNALEERSVAAERECTRLAAELREALESGAAAAANCGAAGELTARVEELRDENKLLRDRNDELCAALEAAERRSASRASDSAQGGDLSAELNSILPQIPPEECESSPVSIDQKLLGQVESLKRFREVFESIDTVLGVDGINCQSCVSIANCLRELQERVRDFDYGSALTAASRSDSATQTDTAGGSENLQQDLLDQERKNDDEKQKLTNLVKDLEMSLEQMKAEYDKCEEYWSNKLEEERDAYNEEQRLGDERLSELIAKIADYERQFTRAPLALPTIDERHSLEAQFTDLDEEFAVYRRTKEAELQAALAESARLAERVDALERRLAASAAAPRCSSPGPRRRRSPASALGAAASAGLGAGAEVRELRARCGRAEAAVRRLHARLQAADLLVTDLYVENCQLAHRRPL